jgi:hypothetical protein
MKCGLLVLQGAKFMCFITAPEHSAIAFLQTIQTASVSQQDRQTIIMSEALNSFPKFRHENTG